MDRREKKEERNHDLILESDIKSNWTVKVDVENKSLRK